MIDKTAEGTRGASERRGVPSSVARDFTARVLIVDDHDLVRDGYQRMLAREEGLEVVGEAANGWEAVELCRKLRPDLILMDVRMPEMDGLEATRRIKAEFPTTGVLVVTTYDNPDYLLEAIEAGAAGYILKDAPKQQLVNAVRRTLNGESPLNQELAVQLISRFACGAYQQRGEPATPPPDMPRPPERLPQGSSKGLTPREIEILAHLAQGKSNPQIAQELVISWATVKTHVQRIIAKLGVSDRTQAAVRAIGLGLVDAERS
ncbi:MAG: Two-component transcriptional response regulator, LuxR family [uncultured Rubrobacteraceae bacterium]|uniref:Two-component transcriptional response regulator, LuxR family n=1 Tax=uncultured Rubrobacteraceae bacterium TaxID=349277 RepID=A0A6J4PXN4_9ACTN|nr:MAG: Two-component transcriptional response regulator, LuxR family [uncultured Rubrobacteraceae bacterium]